MDRIWGNGCTGMLICRISCIVILAIGVVFFICSCASRSAKQNSGDEAEQSRKETKSAHLKIRSKGVAPQDSKKPVLLIKYIQYSIDGSLLGAHDLTKDYERTIDLDPGEHVLHVERLQKGILSARALILDEGDCYEFTIVDGQSGVFEGKALPGKKWNSNGFTGVGSWKKTDSRSRCTN
ncbi:MAG: hypothetical protein EHJ94_09055 [Deltaproteobacteria bacterium]|nr:MAG: hypothetical protein EHJ94_09055 [Deltaproteobacteria bacterium]